MGELYIGSSEFFIAISRGIVLIELDFSRLNSLCDPKFSLIPD